MIVYKAFTKNITNDINTSTMEKHIRILIKKAILLVLLFLCSKSLLSQSLVFDNGGYLKVNGPVCLTINSSSSTAITKTGTNQSAAGIILNNERSRIGWDIATASGVTYSFPLISSRNVAIPVDITPSLAGTVSSTGRILVSTYETDDYNLPLPSNSSSWISNAKPFMPGNKAIDRYYLVFFEGYSAKPTVSLKLAYDPDDLLGNNSITASNLKAQAWNGTDWGTFGVGAQSTGSGSPYVGGIADVSSNKIWVLADGNIGLPIELLSFTANCVEKKVQINWSTASETNNEYFTIEKSADALNWITLTTRKGAGNSYSYLSYSEEDKYPYDENTYYRLKQTDFDGKYTYSNVVVANCASDLNFNLISLNTGENGNEINLKFTANEGDQYYFTLFDYKGQLVQKRADKAISGVNEIHVDVKNLPNSIYLITLQNGEKSILQKVFLK